MIVLTPNATEKIYALQNHGIYAFRVAGATSKQDIKAAIEQEFKVTVTSIRVLNRKGRERTFMKNKRTRGTTILSTKTIAYVTLKAGDKIKMFEEEAAETKDAAPKDAKAAAKELKKSSRQTAEVQEAKLTVKRRTGNRGDK
jgi:large subunit ribosomal protein L23